MGRGCVRNALTAQKRQNQQQRTWITLSTKKSGLKVVTLIATLNPVSQVLW